MPVKNAARYLSECLDSILNQDTINWELIAVDDHSKDESLSILKRYQKEDERIHVLENRGDGIIVALRTAFKHSTGKFITRMDADDRMASNKLSILQEALLNAGKGHVSIGLVNVFSDAIVQEGYLKYEEWLNELARTNSNYEAIYKECVIPSPCWMVHREDLIHCGAFDSDSYPEDYDLCFRYYQHQLKVVPCLEQLHWWRDHPERTSRNDERYQDQTFFELKLTYFFELEREKDKALFIWGVGKKGKALARLLIERGETFHWVCDNPKKIGNEIYGVTVLSYQTLRDFSAIQLLVAVSGSKDQHDIRTYVQTLKLYENKNFYFFC